MNNKQDKPAINLKNELIRYALERVQGELLKEKINFEKIPKDDSVIEILDNAYVNREGTPLAMDIFQPKVDDKKELPVIIYIHGGGLVLGDRRMSHSYARVLAKKGYLVFAIEYRLAPRANVCDQLDDVCAGMDLIGKKLVDFNVDFSRIFLTAESAGAYLSIYVAAMKNSLVLQDAIGHKPSRMVIKALGLFSGMFYTNKKDPIGILLKDQFYGDKAIDENFLRYMDPEDKEIMNNLPPTFLVTSRGDYLNQYTLNYHDALKKNGNHSHLQYYGSDKLEHAFVCMEPLFPESEDAIDKMLTFFEEVAKTGDTSKIMTKEEKEALENINKRIESGEIIKQPAASFIRELNSYSGLSLNRPALELGYRTLTYRQMFARWDKYSEIFSGLGITQKNKSHVGLIAGADEISLTLLYALNQMNVPVSLILVPCLVEHKKTLDQFKAEGITDLIVLNQYPIPGFAKDIRWLSKHVELRNKIAVKVKIADQYKNPLTELLLNKTYHEILNIDGFVRMKSLINQYEASPIDYGTYKDKNVAFILHTSGTSKGIAKPVPLTNKAVNSAALSLTQIEAFQKLKGRAKTTLFVPPFLAYGLINQIHTLLTAGGEILLVPFNFYPDLYSEMSRFGSNIIFVFDAQNKIKKEEEKGKVVNFSQVELIVTGGYHVSKEYKKELDDFLAQHGAKVKTTVGYGLTEAAGCCILADPNDESIFFSKPLPGITLKIQDEQDGKFYDYDDGVHTGGLFIAGDQVSDGRIGSTNYFELVDIDGKKYFETFDAVSSDGNGKLTFIGRTNRYFINNDGIRFDESLVETTLSNQKGIKACALVPRYNKAIHDTVPTLYLEHKESGKKAIEELTSSLKHIYIDEKLILKTNLPTYVIFSKNFIYTNSGKIDISAVRAGMIEGQTYTIIPEMKNNQLIDIRIVEDQHEITDNLSVPEEIAKTTARSLKRDSEMKAMAEMLDELVYFFERPPMSAKKSKKASKKKVPKIDDEKLAHLLGLAFSADKTDYDYED